MKLRTRFFIMLGTFAAGILIALAQQPLAGAGSAGPDWCPAAGGRHHLGRHQHPLPALRCIFVPQILYALLPVLRQRAGLELTA